MFIILSNDNSIRPLLDHYPDLSIDAESGLRTEEDQFDAQVADDYVREAVAVYTQDEAAKTT